MIDKKDVGQSRYYTVLKLYLTISGLWPYHRLCNRFLCFVPLFLCSFSILIPEVLYLLIGSVTLDNIFECVSTIFIAILLSFKILDVMLNSEKVKTCLNVMQKDWISVNTDVDRIILQQHTKYGQYLVTFYAVFMHTIMILYVLKPIILTMRTDDIFVNVTKSSISFVSKLPIRLEYGKRLNQYLYLITVHCYTAVIAHNFATIAVDSLYYILIQHACGMFSIIGNVLENIGKNNDNNFDAKPDKIKDDDYSKVLYCLRRHLLVIDFAERIESLYTKIFLLNLNINVIVGSLYGIQVLINFEKEASDIVGPFSIYIAQLIHLFFHFWQAQFLLDYSVLPFESICRANWYYTSQRCRKLLLLMMYRTSTPCKITAGKTVVLSIDTFAMVLKTSLSFLTMFRSIR